jgi:hypothetical protein
MTMTGPAPKGRPPSGKHNVELIKAGFAQCRYIVSDSSEPALCCGAATDGGSWCEWHRHIVYEPARQRVRDRSAA